MSCAEFWENKCLEHRRCSKEVASPSTQNPCSGMHREKAQILQRTDENTKCQMPSLKNPHSQNWHHKANLCQAEPTTELSSWDWAGESRCRRAVPGSTEHKCAATAGELIPAQLSPCCPPAHLGLTQDRPCQPG